MKAKRLPNLPGRIIGDSTDRPRVALRFREIEALPFTERANLGIIQDIQSILALSSG